MNSYAKVNIFLKITGTRDNYHELASRFVLIKTIHDKIEFVKSSNKTFTIKGNFECVLEQNTIYKAYKELANLFPEVKSYFDAHIIEVEKNIPTHAGLGGGSSNAATFLLMTNKELSLNLSKKELAQIGLKVGADVPFFIYGYKSANVKGIGEVVEEFDEKDIDLEILPTGIECSTAKVFQKFRSDFFKITAIENIEALFETDSLTLLKTLKPVNANDLLEPALSLCPTLEESKKENYFLSGSGSTFFRLVE